MTKYLEPSFTFAPASTQAYRDGWDRIFGQPDRCAHCGLELEGPPPEFLVSKYAIRDQESRARVGNMHCVCSLHAQDLSPVGLLSLE